MLNALNALSENQSITVARPSGNIWLLLAIASSILLHLTIMYVPKLAAVFSITPLGVPNEVLRQAAPWSVVLPSDFEDWKVVLVFSIPVLFVDEILKIFSRKH
jgi:magnesium-transporting ATPase (P-type)